MHSITFRLIWLTILIIFLPDNVTAQLVAEQNQPASILAMQPPSYTAAEWVQSGDPCYPVNIEKNWLKKWQMKTSGRRNPFSRECQPVRIELSWEVEESFRHWGPFGTSRARLKLEEKYNGYLKVVRDQQHGGRVKLFELGGPAPCCPGQVEHFLSNIQGSFLICRLDGSNCKMFVVKDPLKFVVDHPIKHVNSLVQGPFYFTWNDFSDLGRRPEGHIVSSGIYLYEELIKEPYYNHSEILLPDGTLFEVEAKGNAAYTWEEINAGIAEGTLTKAFKIHNTMHLATNEVHSIDGKVTVKIIFHEERERWRVQIVGWNREQASPIKVASGLFRPVVGLDWLLTGEFMLIRNSRVADTWSYKEGNAVVNMRPSLITKHSGLSCRFAVCSSELKGDRPGRFKETINLTGRLIGRKVKLDWVPFSPAACIRCERRTTAPNPVLRRHFGSVDFFQNLSRLELPLKNGHTVSGKVSDWMRYKITLTRIEP